MKRVFRLLVTGLVLILFFLPSGALAQGESDGDKRQTSQLREAFRQVEGLEQVTLEVRGGVVVLKGRVPSLEAKMRAEELAQKLDGVLAVDNGLTVEREVTERVSPVMSNLYAKLQALLTYTPLLGIALVVFGFFLWIAGTLSKWDWLYPKLSPNVFVQDLLRQVVYGAIALLGTLLALEILDATALVGAVLGTAGVLGVAIGFAFKDLAENSLASILLSLRQPFAPNDHVVIDGSEGKVVRLTSRATILLTLEGNHLRIPNSVVFKASILNFTRNPERRFSFLVGIDTEEDLGQALQLASATLLESPGIMASPPPRCFVEELGDSTVNLRMFAWVDQRESEFLKVKSEAIRRVKEAFDQHGVFMPEPIYKVRLEQASGKQSRPKPEHPVSKPADISADVSPDTHLEERINQERVEEERDLLSVTAPTE